MNKKVILIVFTTLFLVIAIFSTPLTFAQLRHWDYCKVSAYGTNFSEEEIDTIVRFYFNAISPPAGSEITNTIYVINYDTGENYTKNLEVGDYVVVRYDDYSPLVYEMTPDVNGVTIRFEGEVFNTGLNNTPIPEFSPILIVPMFITATLLALAYRRKRTSQNRK